MPELQRGLGICSVKNIFNGDDLGMIELDNFSQAAKNKVQPVLQTILRQEPYGPNLDAVQISEFGLLDHAKPGVLASAVDAHDPHMWSLQQVTDPTELFPIRRSSLRTQKFLTQAVSVHWPTSASSFVIPRWYRRSSKSQERTLPPCSRVQERLSLEVPASSQVARLAGRRKDQCDWEKS